jgi:two-component system, NarL family, sensor histidine kinase UhpB
VYINLLIVTKDEQNLPFLADAIEKSALHIRKIKFVSTISAVTYEYRRQKPDLVFFDIENYEDCDSYLAAIQLLNNVIPIVIVTEMQHAATAFALIEKGATDFIMKCKCDALTVEKSVRFAFKEKKIEESLLFSNQRYELATKATSDMVWDWDLLNNKVFRNPEGWEKIIGHNYNNENLGPDSWRDRIHPKDQANCDNIIKNILEGKEIKHFELEYRLRRSNNTYATLTDRGFALRDATGRVIRLIGATNDITEKKDLEKKLAAERRVRQNEITNAVITAQEQEREHLGKELHDNINQILTASKLYIEYSFTNEEMRNELLYSAKGFVETAVSEIRNLTKKLMPPTIGEAGLALSLKELVDTLQKVSSFKIYPMFDNFDEKHLPESLKLTIFRIVQEQLNNITKYAHASEVWIHVRVENEFLLLTVKDNGVGFDTNLRSNGVGIQNIASRAQLYNGTLQIISAKNKGCELNISFKL